MQDIVELTVPERVGVAITQFLDNDPELVKYKVKEEALSHRIAFYLQDLFADLMVDCEYNKYSEGGDKKIASGRAIRPDIIVHHRGYQDANTLAIEVKE